MNTTRSLYLCGSPDSNGEWNPIGERENPSLNSPSKQYQREQEWKKRLLCYKMVEKLHSLIKTESSPISLTHLSKHPEDHKTLIPISYIQLKTLFLMQNVHPISYKTKSVVKIIIPLKIKALFSFRESGRRYFLSVEEAKTVIEADREGGGAVSISYQSSIKRKKTKCLRSQRS